MNMRLQMMQDLKRARYAEATQQAYLRVMDLMVKHHWCFPSTMDREEIRAWVEQEALAKARSPSPGTGERAQAPF